MAIPLGNLLRRIVADLEDAHPDARAEYAHLAVEPELVPIVGDLRHERVWVVARRGDEALFYDDIEEGFNASAVRDGRLIEPGYSEDSLGVAIYKWLHATTGGV